MPKLPVVLSILLVFGLSQSDAEEVQLGMVVGYPEGIDLRYSWEGRWLGVAFTPGIVALAFTQDMPAGIATVAWNPSISVLKTVPLAANFALVGEVGALYEYGYGGGYVKTRCLDCRTQTYRIDRSTLKMDLGLQYMLHRWRFKANPGVLGYREYSKTIDGNSNSMVRPKPDVVYIEPAFSVVFAYSFGNQSAQP